MHIRFTLCIELFNGIQLHYESLAITGNGNIILVIIRGGRNQNHTRTLIEIVSLIIHCLLLQYFG